MPSSGSGFVNSKGATFNPGATVDLGGKLSNYGTLALGLPTGFNTVAMNGQLVQASTATITANVDFRSGQGDLLQVNEFAAMAGSTSAGTIAPSVTGPAPSPLPVTVLTAQTVNGSLTVQDTAVLDMSVAVGSTSATLTLNKADFVSALGQGASSASQQVASALQNAWASGNSGTFGDELAQLANIVDQGAYASAVSALSGESQTAVGATRSANARTFTNTMMSCPAFVDGRASLREQPCVWVRGDEVTTRLKPNGAASGQREIARRMQAGSQARVDENWLLGMSIAQGDSRIRSTNGGTRTDGTTLEAGVTTKFETGGWLLAGGLSYGYGDYDTVRSSGSLGSLAGNGSRAVSSPVSHYANARLRAAYTLDQGSWYLRPSLDADATYIHVPGYRETGAGDLNWSFDAASDVQLAMSPTLEIGAPIRIDDISLRPFAAVGLTWSPDSDWDQRGRLAGLPSGAGSDQQRFEGTDVTGMVRVGLDLFSSKQYEV
jgi:hypothetical protein